MANLEELSNFSIVDETDDKVLLRLDENYAIANKPSKDEPFSPAALVSPERYCPMAPSRVAKARNLIAPSYYVKSPQLEKQVWDEDYGLDDLKARTLREVNICETLKLKPHPNVATYQGCILKYGLITGICYSLYDETLQQRLNPSSKSKLDFQYREAERPLRSRKRVLEGVKQGLLFLHSQHLVHNDIKPDNLMLNFDESPVIIDFDICIPYGKSLKSVGRPIGWHDSKNCYSLYSNDLDALCEVEKWLSDERVKDYQFENDVS